MLGRRYPLSLCTECTFYTAQYLKGKLTSFHFILCLFYLTHQSCEGQMRPPVLYSDCAPACVAVIVPLDPTFLTLHINFSKLLLQITKIKSWISICSTYVHSPVRWIRLVIFFSFLFLSRGGSNRLYFSVCSTDNVSFEICNEYFFRSAFFFFLF